jgi:hypothetical protein
MEEKAGVFTLTDGLRNICFVQGLYTDRIRLVRSRISDNFDETAETALEGESAIIYKKVKYKVGKGSPPKCKHCGISDHISSKCYGKEKGETRVNRVSKKIPVVGKETTCFHFGEQGHMARNCRPPPPSKGYP